MRPLSFITVGLLALAAVIPARPDARAAEAADYKVDVTTNEGKPSVSITEISPDGSSRIIENPDRYRVEKDGGTSVYELPDGTRVQVTTDGNSSRVEIRSEKRTEPRDADFAPQPKVKEEPKTPEDRIRALEERVKQLERERATGPRVVVPNAPNWTPQPPPVFKWDMPDLKEFQFRLGPDARLFTPDTRREMQRSLEEAQRNLKDAMKQFQEITPEQKKEMQKALRDAMPEIRRSIEGAMKELQKSLKELEKSQKDLDKDLKNI